MMKTIAILLYPDVLLLDVAGPSEAFSIANRFLPPEQHYRIVTVGIGGPMIRAANGITLVADRSIADPHVDYDVLLIPGGPGAYNGDHSQYLPWLNAAVERAPRYGSVCTGAFILGQAGLLDGHRVTTHWNYTDKLARLYPAAEVETNRIYIHDGPLISSGGITAGIDLALAMIAEHHGTQVARDVAKVLLVVMRRQGGQAQFNPLLADVVKQDSPIARVQQYVLNHLDEDISVERMADMAAMSTRHFSRLFAREVNLTPMSYVQNARIDRARNLLESSTLPLKTIAFHSGFGSVRQMRSLFTDKLGLSPAQYRRQFNL